MYTSNHLLLYSLPRLVLGRFFLPLEANMKSITYIKMSIWKSFAVDIYFLAFV